MNILVIGLAIFFAIHLLPSISAVRQSLIDQIGERGYKAFFALIAALGFVLIVYGKAKAPWVHVYVPPQWGRHAAMLLVLLALILLPAANMPGNIKRFTRHPMLWGVFLWSAGHLLANGDQASLLLFGGFAVFSLLAMLSQTLRGARLQTGVVALRKDLMVVVAGVIAYGLFLFLHPYLFGVRVV